MYNFEESNYGTSRTPIPSKEITQPQKHQRKQKDFQIKGQTDENFRHTLSLLKNQDDIISLKISEAEQSVEF